MSKVPLAEFKTQVEKPWPWGLSTKRIVQDLASVDCPTKFGLQLGVLQKQNKLDQVFAYKSFSDETLFGTLLEQNKVEHAKMMTDLGALNHYSKLAPDPVDLLLKLGSFHKLSEGKGSDKRWKAIYNLALSMFENTNHSILSGHNIERINGAKFHPVRAALLKTIQTKAEPEKADERLGMYETLVAKARLIHENKQAGSRQRKVRMRPAFS